MSTRPIDHRLITSWLYPDSCYKGYRYHCIASSHSPPNRYERLVVYITARGMCIERTSVLGLHFTLQGYKISSDSSRGKIFEDLNDTLVFSKQHWNWTNFKKLSRILFDWSQQKYFYQCAFYITWLVTKSICVPVLLTVVTYRLLDNFYFLNTLFKGFFRISVSSLSLASLQI